jgi:hypothetical protein
MQQSRLATEATREYVTTTEKRKTEKKIGTNFDRTPSFLMVLFQSELMKPLAMVQIPRPESMIPSETTAQNHQAG